MIKKIQNLKPAVLRILQDNPKARDNDRLLVIKVWEQEMISFNTMFLTSDQFAKAYELGKISSSETITRASRLIKEKHEDLRGKSYSVRKELEEEVRVNIKSI